MLELILFISGRVFGVGVFLVRRSAHVVLVGALMVTNARRARDRLNRVNRATNGYGGRRWEEHSKRSIGGRTVNHAIRLGWTEEKEGEVRPIEAGVVLWRQTGEIWTCKNGRMKERAKDAVTGSWQAQQNTLRSMGGGRVGGELRAPSQEES
ncbi:MAG: hypothetical protein ACTSXC_06995 [Candidatus Freyarchaeota archaeon]